MTYSQQVLKSAHFHRLKNLNDLLIEFNQVGLTGILGPNGCGKSTVLHALCCIYQPNDPSSVNYKFSDFFTPTIHSPWSGSRFEIIHEYRVGPDYFRDANVEYTKNSDRWAPKYERRPKRYISFIGIKTTVPAIELESHKSRILFNTVPLNDRQSIRRRELAGNVMNRSYTSLNLHTTAKHKEYLGVTYQSIDYSSLNMGAGEQRIFYLIGEVLKCPNYGLVLVDEIDLLLHKHALKRLLIILNELALEKNLQIIFTTHNHSILDSEEVSFMHLFQTDERTMCFCGTKPQALYRLTGEQEKPFEIFVEDKLARFICNNIARELGAYRMLSVKEFGPAINCFTCLAGAVITNLPNIENVLFVIDGDTYRTTEEKEVQLRRVLTGDLDIHNEQRTRALGKIRQFALPVDVSPEEYISQCILRLDIRALEPNEIEIYEALRDIHSPLDRHNFLDLVVERLGPDKDIILNEIIQLLRKCVEWEVITQDIREWLRERIELTTERESPDK